MWEKYILFSSNVLSVLTTFFPFFEDEINSFFRINIAFLQFFWIYFVFVDGSYTVWLLHHLPFKEVYIPSCPLCLPFLLLIFVCNGEFGVDTFSFNSLSHEFYQKRSSLVSETYNLIVWYEGIRIWRLWLLYVHSKTNCTLKNNQLEEKRVKFILLNEFWQAKWMHF